MSTLNASPTLFDLPEGERILAQSIWRSLQSLIRRAPVQPRADRFGGPTLLDQSPSLARDFIACAKYE